MSNESPEYFPKGLMPFIHIEELTGEELNSPFPVFVAGVNGEVLGMGQLTGGYLDEQGELMPLISIYDSTMGHNVSLTGNQCEWFNLGDNQEEFIEYLAKNMDKIIEPSEYFSRLMEKHTNIEPRDISYCHNHKHSQE